MPAKLESRGSWQADDKSGAAVDHGPVCVTARRTWNCSWYHVTGVVEHGRHHADRAPRGSCRAA